MNKNSNDLIFSLHQINSSDVKKELGINFESSYKNAWVERAHKFVSSFDSFIFQIDEEDVSYINDLRPGDHIALWPKNITSVKEFVKRMINIPKDIHESEVHEVLDGKDLALPLIDVHLEALLKVCPKGEDAYHILYRTLQDHPRNYPSVEELVSMLQPASIPFSWLKDHAPSMMPRFFSVASILRKNRTVSVLQSMVQHNSGKTGTASRWLRAMRSGERALAKFCQSEFHLPSNQICPIICVSAGSGISPFRSFWASNARNPFYLFYGTKTVDTLPFSQELENLSRFGHMKYFLAFSQEPGKDKKYVQDLLKENKDLILPILLSEDPCRIFVCGFPAMESAVRVALIVMMAEGNDEYKGLGIFRATQRLAILKNKNIYIAEVYGVNKFDNEGLEMMWKAALEKVAKISQSLENHRIPRRRQERRTLMSRYSSSITLGTNRLIDGLDESFHSWKSALNVANVDE